MIQGYIYFFSVWGEDEYPNTLIVHVPQLMHEIMRVVQGLPMIPHLTCSIARECGSPSDYGVKEYMRTKQALICGAVRIISSEDTARILITIFEVFSLQMRGIPKKCSLVATYAL